MMPSLGWVAPGSPVARSRQIPKVLHPHCWKAEVVLPTLSMLLPRAAGAPSQVAVRLPRDPQMASPTA